MKDYKLSSSLEDYLEAICHIIDEQGAARVKEISARLGVNYSSVTGALKILTGKGLINYAPYELITLTDKGKPIAMEVIRRHKTLCSFFERILKIDHDRADEAACKMEHEISGEIVERLIKFMEYVERCPHNSIEWLDDFGFQCTDRNRKKECDICNVNKLDKKK